MAIIQQDEDVSGELVNTNIALDDIPLLIKIQMKVKMLQSLPYLSLLLTLFPHTSLSCWPQQIQR